MKALGARVLIGEKADRRAHVPTAAGLAGRKRSPSRTPPKRNHVPSGKLGRRIGVGVDWTDGIRNRWSDRRERVIEGSLDEIIVALAEVGAALRRHRAEQVRKEAERLDPLAQGIDALLRDQETAASKPAEPAYPRLCRPSV